MYHYQGSFSGIGLDFQFHYPGTASFYGNWLTPCDGTYENVCVPEEDIELWQKRFNIPDPAYTEYTLSCSYACDRLMQDDRLVFHGAVFLWKGSAYLFTAPSGTGKTTQLKHWDRLYPDEVCILNGDKPILEVTSGKDILVHPSPWKGKEGYGRDDITAPLKGIILLKQEKENSIEPMEPADAASALFGRIYSTFNTEKEVLTAGMLIEKILKKTPVWLLKNRGDEMSATMTHDFLSKEIRP